MYSKAVLAVFVAISVSLATGCGGSSYPEPQVTTAVGHSGKCESCGKEIEKVGVEQFVVFGSSRFIVCDEDCEDALRDELRRE